MEPASLVAYTSPLDCLSLSFPLCRMRPFAWKNSEGPSELTSEILRLRPLGGCGSPLKPEEGSYLELGRERKQLKF